jgi:hypothetical protein
MNIKKALSTKCLSSKTGEIIFHETGESDVFPSKATLGRLFGFDAWSMLALGLMVAGLFVVFV